MKKFNGLRHGEIILVPRKIEAGEVSKHKSFIVGHSETGHNHVLEGTEFEVTETEKKELYFRLFEPTNLVHQKTTDKHRTLVVPPTTLKRYHDTEYDPYDKIIKDSKD